MLRYVKKKLFISNWQGCFVCLFYLIHSNNMFHFLWTLSFSHPVWDVQSFCRLFCMIKLMKSTLHKYRDHPSYFKIWFPLIQACNRECLKQNLLWIAFRLNHHKRRRPIKSLEKHCIFSSMPRGLFHAILPVFSRASSFLPKAKPTAHNSYKFFKTITNLTSCGLNCWKRKFDSKWQPQIHNRVLKLFLSADFSCQSCDPALFCIQILVMPSFLVNHNYNKILESDWVLACSVFCWIGFTQRLSLVSISQLVTQKYA